MNAPEQISRAAGVLRQGGLVAIPTETVYGLAADAENELALRRLFAAKGRPSSHPVIVHLAEVGAVESWVSAFPAAARRLAAAFWPGPLTLVLPRSHRAIDAVTGGQGTVALRVPSHPVAQQILREFGGGLAAPSANRFGKLSPTTAEHVRQDLGSEVDLIVDGGPCAVGVESTIVDISGESPALLRPGGVAQEELERVLGTPLPWRKTGAVRTPGALASHYAPRAGVVLCPAGELPRRAEALARTEKKVAILSSERAGVPSGMGFFAVPPEPTGFARALYATLREIDLQGYELVLVALPEARGLGLAVVDRLTRAAARE